MSSATRRPTDRNLGEADTICSCGGAALFWPRGSAMNFDQASRFAVEQGASDVHLQTGAAPLLRINGQIRTVESPPVANQDLRQFILSIKKGLTADQLDRTLFEGFDFSYFIPGVSRFRCNIYSHLGTPATVLRVIKLKVRTLDE